MYCNHCGAKLPGIGVFCPNCGNSIAETATPATEIPAPADLYDSKPENPDFTEPAAPQQPEYAEPMPMQQPYGDAAPYYGEAMPEPVLPKPKRSIKRILIIALASVLSLALVAGATTYFVVTGSPEYKVKSAIENTFEDLTEILEKAPDLCEMLDNLAECEDGVSMDVRLEEKCSYDFDDWQSESSVSAQYEMDYDLKGHELALRGEVANEYDDDYSRLSFDGYANDDQLMLSIPEISEDYYSVPLPNTFEEFADSALGKYIGVDPSAVPDKKLDFFPDEDLLEQFMQEYEEQIENFTDSIEIEEVDERIDGADRDLTVYRINADWEEGMELLEDYFNFVYENVYGSFGMEEMYPYNMPEFDDVDAELDILVGINDDDRLAAIELSVDGGSGSILFEGRDNLWNDVVFLSEGEEEFRICVEETSKGFALVLTDGYDEVLIECNDDRGELVLEAGNEEIITIEYGCEDNGAQISFALSYEEHYSYDYYYEESIDLELGIYPLRKIKTPTDSPVELFELSRSEIKDLIAEWKEAVEEKFG